MAQNRRHQKPQSSKRASGHKPDGATEPGDALALGLIYLKYWMAIEKQRLAGVTATGPILCAGAG